MARQPQGQPHELLFSKGEKIDNKRVCITASLPRPISHSQQTFMHKLRTMRWASIELVQTSLREGQFCFHLLFQAAQHSFALEDMEEYGLDR